MGEPAGVGAGLGDVAAEGEPVHDGGRRAGGSVKVLAQLTATPPARSKLTKINFPATPPRSPQASKAVSYNQQSHLPVILYQQALSPGVPAAGPQPLAWFAPSAGTPDPNDHIHTEARHTEEQTW